MAVYTSQSDMFARVSFWTLSSGPGGKPLYVGVPKEKVMAVPTAGKIVLTMKVEYFISSFG